ncbi:MAG TPA: STAS domain-containing protein [Sphingobium sp.]|nr:STAS domain-containing protein [Sphingobium sp.]
MSAIMLPAVLDKLNLSLIARELMDQCEKGEALIIDGSKVNRVGLAGLQLLASAALSAQDRSLAFQVVDASDELKGAASLSGLSAMFGIAA